MPEINGDLFFCLIYVEAILLIVSGIARANQVLFSLPNILETESPLQDVMDQPVSSFAPSNFCKQISLMLFDVFGHIELVNCC